MRLQRLMTMSLLALTVLGVEAIVDSNHRMTVLRDEVVQDANANAGALASEKALFRSEKLMPTRITTTTTTLNATEMVRLYGTTTTTTLPCANHPKDWKDSQGDYCFQYEAGSFCTRQKSYGNGWKLKAGFFESYAAKGQIHCPDGWNTLNGTCYSPAHSTGTYSASTTCVKGDCESVYAHCKAMNAKVATRQEMHHWFKHGGAVPSGKQYAVTSTFQNGGENHWLVKADGNDYGWHFNGCCREADNRFFVCVKEDFFDATTACCACGGGTVPYVAPAPPPVTTAQPTEAVTTTYTPPPAAESSF